MKDKAVTYIKLSAGRFDFRHSRKIRILTKWFLFHFTAKWFRSLHPAVQVPRRKTSPGMSRNARPSTPEQQTEAPGPDKECTEFQTRPRILHRSTPEFAHPISSQRFPQNFRKGIFDILTVSSLNKSRANLCYLPMYCFRLPPLQTTIFWSQH